jgi:putative acetyltransferase
MVHPVRIEPYRPLHQQGFAALVSNVLAELGFERDSVLDADLESPERFYEAIWVVLDEDEVVGSVAVRRAPLESGPRGRRLGADAELKRMYLYEPYRRRGLGSRLLDLAVRWARDQGYAALTLDTGSKMEAAQRFYEAAGFERVGYRTEMGVRGGRCEVLYRLTLGPAD